MCSQVTCYQLHAGEVGREVSFSFLSLFGPPEARIGIFISSLLVVRLTIVPQLFLTYALGKIYIADSDLLGKMPDCTSD